MLNTIIQGDCLEVMKDIPAGSINLILCDLPYATTANSWDVLIPFEPLWEQYKRVIKKNGAVVLTASQPFTTKVINSNPKWFKYHIVWVKEQGTNLFNAPYQPLKTHEEILVFSPASSSFAKNNLNMVYNPQMSTGHKPYKAKARNSSGNHIFHQTPKNKKENTSGERYPTSIVYFNTEKGLHPTQKPVALFEYLIKTYTNPGETVLDNCSGSGTTALAAYNTGRDFICIEKDEGYYKASLDRLARAKQQLRFEDMVG